MPHYARKHQLEGNLVYHVLNRANAGSDIFLEDEDYLYFKHILLKYCEQKQIIIYHYCIMPSHYHLLLEIQKPEFLSAAMAGINKSYTAHYHKKLKTSGYLWQGRFKSKPVQKDRYMLACGRYIERNPVAANLVTEPEDYPYSSAKYYIKGKEDTLISEDSLYKDFGQDIKARRINYKQFLLDFDIDAETKYNSFEVPIGDFSFSSKLLKKRGRFLPKRQGCPRAKMFVT